jgi:hypothetical protein
MSYVKEETNHPSIRDISFSVLEKEPEEVCESWEIISLDIDHFAVNTPQQMVELGVWLIAEGKRIQREYTPKGKRRKTTPNPTT